MIDGWRHFGYAPPEGMTDADMARRHAEVFLEVIRGEGFAKPNPTPDVPEPARPVALEPYSAGLRERIWWGAGTNATAEWAAKLGHEPAVFDAEDRRERQAVPRAAGRADPALQGGLAGGRARAEPRVSVSRSIFALVDDRDRMYFGRDRSEDQIGFLGGSERAIFGRSYAAEPDVLIDELKADEAIAEADTLLLTVPNQLGVDYNAHVIEAILKHVAPGLGWR